MDQGGTTRRLTVFGAVVLLAFVVLPASANSATVTKTYGGKIDGTKVDIVRLTAAPGERNAISVKVTLRSTFTRTTVRDRRARLTAARGCVQLDKRRVRCRSRNDLGLVRVRAGDRDDSVIVGSAPRDYRLYYLTEIRGGRGDDHLDADDGAEALDGGPGDDRLRGSPGYDSIQGGTGNDKLFGRAHGDFLEGGPGDDAVHGGPGNDDLLGGSLQRASRPSGRDRLLGGPGGDNIDDSDVDSRTPDVGPDVLIGGDGEDTVDSYRRRTGPVTVDLETGESAGEAGEGDSLQGFETVIGGEADDVINGDVRANWLDGRDGNDEIHGRGGDDLIFGWDADMVTGDRGDDDVRIEPDFAGTLTCGPGADVVRMDVFLEKPEDLPGPLIESPCERLTNGSSFSIDAVPTLDLDGESVFDVFKVPSNDLKLLVSEPTPPYASLASAAIEVGAVRLAIPSRPLVRARVSPLGAAPFAWRYVPPISGAAAQLLALNRVDTVRLQRSRERNP
jgi:Ca2+-binding RTX toxin-like protein